MRNKHLKKLLDDRGYDDETTWSSIIANEGSVQHLEFLDEEEKLVFKTAFEIDQRWLIELAADRTPYICQSQSLNLFLAADVHKKDLHKIHFSAWEKGVKSLYYCRSKSIQRADVLANMNVGSSVSVPVLGRVNGTEEIQENSLDYDECLACQ